MAQLVKCFAETQSEQDMVAPVWNLSTSGWVGWWEQKQLDSWSSLASQSTPGDELQVQRETLAHKIWWRVMEERHQYWPLTSACKHTHLHAHANVLNVHILNPWWPTPTHYWTQCMSEKWPACLMVAAKFPSTKITWKEWHDIICYALSSYFNF